MKKSRLKRILAGLTMFGSIIMALFVLPTTVLAQSGLHYYEDSYNINAWNGGPEIAAYNGNVTNDDFLALPAVTNPNYYNIFDRDGGPFNGYCIGDKGNSSSNPQAWLSGSNCDSSVPWGGNFIVEDCGNNEVAFYSVRWSDFLAPASNSNGSPFYLNSGIVCYHQAAA